MNSILTKCSSSLMAHLHMQVLNRTVLGIDDIFGAGYPITLRVVSFTKFFR